MLHMDIMMMPVSYNASSAWSTSSTSSTPSTSVSMEMVTIDLESESENSSPSMTSSELKDCYICLSSIPLNTGFTLDCNHTFHSGCYNTYIVHELKVKETNTVLCPACRECIIKIVQQPVESDEDDYPMLYDATTTERQEIPDPSNDDFTAVYNRHRMCFITIQFSLIVTLLWFIASVIACSTGKDTPLC